MVYPEYVHKIISRLECAGESAYVVGGGLRDMLIGVAPHDYDVTTSALPQRTAEIFSDMRVIKTGIKHGTLTVICDGEPVEITTFRIDGCYTDSRHPDSVKFTDDITEDLSRRDFTVNAMAYSAARGLIDPFGGRQDLERRLIRAVGNPSLRFSEDALRIMRAFRFSAQLGFDIESQTLAGCAKMSTGLKKIARERIGSELLRLITSPSPARPLALMKENGIFPYIFGAYAPSDMLIKELERMPREVHARLGFILSGTDKDTAREILQELRCSGKQTTGALAVLTGASHCVATSADARRHIACTGAFAHDAALASELLGISPAGAAELTLRQQNTPCDLRGLKINGKDVAAMGVTGKQIGNVLNALLQRVICSPELNERDILTRLAEQMINEGNDSNGTA